ncbi:hypothetical protein FRC0337_01965 [Corynebacterium diphtheriae]|nr:hypothetical protein BKD75_10565 [Corynebacterium diphtheriae]CAB0859516.1 hypothetical protein FRC0337_01965 [Corynebacterium diphtheriae]VEJ66300.1 Uncharacterised protein [Corynebacterium diphtheriae]
MESGQVAWIASGKPFSASQQIIKTSLTPRLAISVHTCDQNAAPSLVAYPQAHDVLDAFHVHTDSHVVRSDDDVFVVTDFYT